MKKIYSFGFLLSLILLSGCSKDILKSYDKRIIGVWRITDVDRIGIGGSTSDLPFNNGTFTFYENGSLNYVNAANAQYQGNWDIVKKTVNDEQVHGLQVTAVNYASQQVLSQYYDEMNFTSTDHFKTTINSTLHNFVTYFKR